jgi:ribose/xylose/arabinose/galactoside ABC-type transport system permease subunit
LTGGIDLSVGSVWGMTAVLSAFGSGIATALAAAGRARVAMNYSSDRKGAERVAQAIIDSAVEPSAGEIFWEVNRDGALILPGAQGLVFMARR